MTTTDATPTTPFDAEPRFESVQEVRDALRDSSYLADDGISGIVFLASRAHRLRIVGAPVEPPVALLLELQRELPSA